MNADEGVLHYRIHHLAMADRPPPGWPALPSGREATALLVAEAPPAWFFLALQEAAGRDHAREAPLGGDPRALDAWLADPAVRLSTLLRDGWPQGFFLIDARAGDEARIVAFGVVPQARGRGYGRFLVGTAVRTAWAIAGVRRLVVSTTSLDHPRALALAQAEGFAIVADEAATRRVAPRP